MTVPFDLLYWDSIAARTPARKFNDFSREC